MGAAFRHNSLCIYKYETDIKQGFPLIVDDMTLAFHLGIRNKTLWWLVDLRNKEQAYNCFGIPEYRADGSFKKIRRIQEPIEQLKRVHRVMNGVFSEVPMPKPIAAYVRGLKVSDAAAQHIRPSYWYKEDETDPGMLKDMEGLDKDPRFKKIARHKDPHDPKSKKGWLYHQPIVAIHLDISNFFNSIHASWIRRFFVEKVGYSHYVGTLLATLCTVKTSESAQKQRVSTPEAKESGSAKTFRFLPQGSPISGSLANLVGYWMFGETIEALLQQHSPDWVFAIYSDDIVLSHPDQTIAKEDVEKVRDTIIKVIEDSGFKINHKKVKIVRSKNDRVKILGCVVNEKLNLPKYVYKNLKSLIHNCLTHGWTQTAQTLGHPSEGSVVQYVRGMLQYVKQIRPDRFEELDKLFQEAIVKHPVQEILSTVIVGKEEEKASDESVGAPATGSVSAGHDGDDFFTQLAKGSLGSGGDDERTPSGAPDEGKPGTSGAGGDDRGSFAGDQGPGGPRQEGPG